jgi:V8-like Glu-specific endopeptidase
MRSKSFILSITCLTSINTFATVKPKVVYGDDNRIDVYETTNVLYKKLALSTAAMIPTNSLTINGDLVNISGGTLQGDGICADEKFAKQPTSAMCSGFLVGSQYLVTAGHCITSQTDCDNNSFVFDYAKSLENSDPSIVNSSSVYKCSSIVSRAQDRSTLNDYALIKLDRVVDDRSPLSFRTKGKIDLKADILVIGHPSGLPTKISDGAYVRSNDNKYYFQANLDTFGGNSGSAVFDAKTGVVEGILVRGETDYAYDSANSCYRTKKCDMESCRGEDVTRITMIKDMKNLK